MSRKLNVDRMRRYADRSAALEAECIAQAARQGRLAAMTPEHREQHHRVPAMPFCLACVGMTAEEGAAAVRARLDGLRAVGKR